MGLIWVFFFWKMDKIRIQIMARGGKELPAKVECSARGQLDQWSWQQQLAAHQFTPCFSENCNVLPERKGCPWSGQRINKTPGVMTNPSPSKQNISLPSTPLFPIHWHEWMFLGCMNVAVFSVWVREWFLIIMYYHFNVIKCFAL